MMILFIHSLNKHLLNYNYYVPGSILDARKASVTYRICHRGIYILLGETVNKQTNRCIYNLKFRSGKGYEEWEREREIMGQHVVNYRIQGAEQMLIFFSSTFLPSAFLRLFHVHCYAQDAHNPPFENPHHVSWPFPSLAVFVLTSHRTSCRPGARHWALSDGRASTRGRRLVSGKGKAQKQMRHDTTTGIPFSARAAALSWGLALLGLGTAPGQSFQFRNEEILWKYHTDYQGSSFSPKFVCDNEA